MRFCCEDCYGSWRDQTCPYFRLWESGICKHTNWTKDDSKRVIPHKNVPIGGPSDVLLNFRSLTAIYIAAMNRTFKRERQNIQILITSTLLRRSREIFTGDSYQEWLCMGGPTTSSKKSNMKDSSHIEMLISL